MPGLNVHLYPSPLVNESRILRITAALRDAGMFDAIEVVGITQSGLAHTEQVDAIRTFRRLPRECFVKTPVMAAKILSTLSWARKVFDIYRNRQITCVNAHSLAVLPLAARLAHAHQAKLIYDTHELETEVKWNAGLRKPLAKWTERRFIRRADKIFVVSPSIADWYAESYNLPTPIVVRNVPQPVTERQKIDRTLREKFDVPTSSIVFIYQGGLLPGRGVERLLDVFARSRNNHLFLMGSGPLHPQVQEFAQRFPHIHALPPVSPGEVLATTRQADIGICLTDDSCLSHRYSLPNKLFEYLHADLPVIVNPLPEQKRIVADFGCGWIAPRNDDELAQLFACMTHEVLASSKANVSSAANAFNWDNEKQNLIAGYREIFGA